MSKKEPAPDAMVRLSQVTLIYHKKLDDDWRAAAEKLRTALSEAPSSSEAAVTVIGRSHKQVSIYCTAARSVKPPCD